MSYGITTYNEKGIKTFSTDMRIIRQEVVHTLPANSTGTINLAGFDLSMVGLRFTRVTQDDRLGHLPLISISGETLTYWTAESVYLTVIGYT